MVPKPVPKLDPDDNEVSPPSTGVEGNRLRAKTEPATCQPLRQGRTVIAERFAERASVFRDEEAVWTPVENEKKGINRVDIWEAVP